MDVRPSRASLRGYICLTAVIGVISLAAFRIDNAVAYSTLGTVIGGYFGAVSPKRDAEPLD
jgi:uncharacterized membrane protein